MNNYIKISNPTFENECTGNFSIGPAFMEKYNQNKNFLFDWVNPKTNKRESKILPYNYVVSHLKPAKLRGDKTGENSYHFIISYFDIKNYK